MTPPSFFTNLSLLKRDDDAMHLVGMPREHARIFAQAARQEKCIISSRQLGRVCTGLMREGYDTKGFRMKSKSCDFGPMAGFICVDERLHKKGPNYNKQQKADVVHALHGDDWDTTGRWKASVEQICLTETRLRELMAWDDAEYRDARINPQAVPGVPNILYGSVSSPVQFNYVLRRELRFNNPVWALYATDRVIKPVVLRSAWAIAAPGLELKPLLALVNPYPPYDKGHYKNCCTGDYDLFGVWPKKSIFQRLGEDRRIAGMPSVMTARQRNDQTLAWEDKRLGNISDRVHTVAQVINSLAHGLNGGRGECRDVIHHSDEAGRPFISGIDDHIIAFIPIPGGQTYTVGVQSPGGVPNPIEWRAFLEICDDAGYRIIVNAAWKAQLNAWGLEELGTTGDVRGWRTPHSSLLRST